MFQIDLSFLSGSANMVNALPGLLKYYQNNIIMSYYTRILNDAAYLDEDNVDLTSGEEIITSQSHIGKINNS
jgi:hypothetical protein